MSLRGMDNSSHSAQSAFATRCASLVLGVMLVASLNATTGARESWEYAPYRVHVWLAVRHSVNIPATIQADILSRLQIDAHLYAGVTWQLTAEQAPSAIMPTLATMLDSVTLEQVMGAASNALDCDKLMLLTIRPEDDGYAIACRELDCHARSFSQVVRTRTLQLPRLSRDCVMTVAEAFSPLVRVEQSRGIQATVRVRAGGLVRQPHSVSLVKEGDLFRPVIRRNDRRGEPKPGGIQEIDWTYLIVRQQEEYLLQCDVLSAMRNPLAGRSSASVEKLGLRVRPRGKTTLLQLVSRDNDARPLEGYEIFAKRPLPKNPEVKNTPVRLGLTDWRGTINVPPDDMPLRLVYVRNGTHLIARLPVIPGYMPKAVIALPSDDVRLETEAFVQGMETTVMDLVARREILAARIERRLEQGKVDSARKLLEEIQSFQTKEELESLLVQRQQATVATIDPREQERIDRMLTGTRILLNRYLNPDQLVALQRKVEAAENGGTSPPPRSTARAKPPAAKAESPAAE